MRKLTLVVGAAGQLGDALATQLPPRYEVVARSRADLDVTNAAAIGEALAQIGPDVVINAAAYTDVDGAERDPVTALAVNAWAVRALARAASAADAVFVHYSTDFVFDGTTDRPYREEDVPNPRGVYAASKLLGEWFAAEAPRHYVLRVESLFGGRRARSSVDKILAGVQAGTEVRAFADRSVSPSFVDDVVTATDALIDLGAEPGVYHCVNSGWTTWLELARTIAEVAGHPDAPIASVAMADVPLEAPRPRFAALSNAKLARVGIPMPTWRDALIRHIRGRR